MPCLSWNVQVEGGRMGNAEPGYKDTPSNLTDDGHKRGFG